MLTQEQELTLIQVNNKIMAEGVFKDHEFVYFIFSIIITAYKNQYFLKSGITHVFGENYLYLEFLYIGEYYNDGEAQLFFVGDSNFLL